MNIKIFQTYYKEAQKPRLDPSFIPLDNTSNPKPLWTEYWLFLNHYRSGEYRLSEYSGILSWKFNEKTRITGKEFFRYIESNPDQEVYFINPYPNEVYSRKNIWHHGELFHPGLIEMTQYIFEKIGYDIDIEIIRNDEGNTLFCNYWVGSKDFWNKYMSFTLPIFNYINNELSEEKKAQIYSHADKSRGKNAAYFSFIFERLFTTLLVYEKNIDYCAYEYDLNGLQRLYNKPITYYIYNKRVYAKLSALEKYSENSENSELDNILSGYKELIDSLEDYMNSPSVLIENELRKFPFLSIITKPIYIICSSIYKFLRKIFFILIR